MTTDGHSHHAGAQSEGVQRFIHALREAEDRKDAGPLVEVFDDHAQINSPVRDAHAQGREGAREFWERYLSAFEHVRSEFTRVEERDGFAALEWTSEGELPTGQPLRYNGVTLLDLDGDRVTRFSTYYDSAAFTPGGSKNT